MHIRPYKEEATDIIYNLFFCDDIALYKLNAKLPYQFPFDILFSETSTITDLQKIIDDAGTEPRTKMLAYNRQAALGHPSGKKELLGVIVEVGLDDGLDTLACFVDGTARYINHAGNIIVWETPDNPSTGLTQELFQQSREIIEQIGPWDKPRLDAPATDNVRISFLVSDGLYFGEGPVDVLFNDPMAAPALTTATYMLQYLIAKSTERKKE